PSELLFATLNGDAWARAEEGLPWRADQGLRPRVALAQETRFVSESAQLTAGSRAPTFKAKLASGPVVRAGESANAASEGVSTVVDNSLGFARQATGPGCEAARVLARRAALSGFQVLFVSVYLAFSMGAQGANLELMEELQRWLLEQPRQFVIGGDWSVKPEAMAEVTVPSALPLPARRVVALRLKGLTPGRHIQVSRMPLAFDLGAELDQDGIAAFASLTYRLVWQVAVGCSGAPVEDAMTEWFTKAEAVRRPSRLPRASGCWPLWARSRLRTGAGAIGLGGFCAPA
ncbi:unnamed protein product, partial [Prorocentrum cordatum]